MSHLTLGRPHVGLRKIKSLIAVAIVFLVWQAVRLIFPQLEVHPVFGYIYAIIEMRDTPEKSKTFGFRRIKATFIGLAIGLLFITFSMWFGELLDVEWQRALVDLTIILIATLLALCIAEWLKCENFCGIAAIIAVICLVSHSDDSRYLYATLRVVQTLIGVFVAMAINFTVHRRKNEDGEAAPAAPQSTDGEQQAPESTNGAEQGK